MSHLFCCPQAGNTGTPGIFFYLPGLFNGHQTKPQKGTSKAAKGTKRLLKKP
jgi:hypothetical protein